MGAWQFVFLAISLVVVSITGAPLGEEDTKPCLSWECARKRALELSNLAKEDDENSCLSWECKRDLILRNKFLNAVRAAESANKKSSVTEEEEKPCLSWDCRRKRRAAAEMQANVAPESAADDPRCLTDDCRAGKRSIEEPSLMKRLRLARANANPQSDPACLAWHCMSQG